MSGDPAAFDDGPAAFVDGKAAGAFRTIGEVAQALAIRPHVLRYWEEQFPMLRPVKRAGGRRYYRAEDVALLQTIDRLVHREGYTLRGARLKLEEGAHPPVKPARPKAIAPPDLAVSPPTPPAPSGVSLHEIAARLAMIRAELADSLQD